MYGILKIFITQTFHINLFVSLYGNTDKYSNKECKHLMASYHKIDQIIEGVNALLDNTYIISSLGKMFNFT